MEGRLQRDGTVDGGMQPDGAIDGRLQRRRAVVGSVPRLGADGWRLVVSPGCRRRVAWVVLCVVGRLWRL
jgi:hypothetical protein